MIATIQPACKAYKHTQFAITFSAPAAEVTLKADPFQIGAVLKDPQRFVVPIYQRSYDWDITPHVETFFEQVAAKADERMQKNARLPHYMGALLVIPRGAFSFGKMPILDVVDGQQRLTTFQIFLIALRDVAMELGQSETAALLNSFLVNPEGPSLHERIERYKLLPTAYNRKMYFQLVDLGGEQLRSEYPQHFYKNGNVREGAPALLRAWGFLRLEILDFVERAASNGQSGIEALSGALLEDFQVIVITLDEKTDDAQVIFETLNAGGKPLAAMDLVRNDVFHRANRLGENVDALMEGRWEAFEKPFWKESSTRGRIKKPRIDFFLSDTLAAETGDEILLTELYAHYKRFVTARRFSSVDAELETLLRHAPTYIALADPTGSSALSKAGRQLGVLDVTTAYPLIFVIAASDASEEKKSSLYSLIVSYIVRRMICGLTAKNYNKVFPSIATELRKEGASLVVGVAAFAALKGETQRFPDDEEFLAAITTRSQYGYIQQSRLRYILGEIEMASRSRFDEATGLPEGLTIEHILPDTWMEHWPLPDGSKAPADLVTGMTELQLKLITERQAA